MVKIITAFGYECELNSRGTYTNEDTENETYIEVHVPPNKSILTYNIRFVDNLMGEYKGEGSSIKLAELNLMSNILDESFRLKNLYDKLNLKVFNYYD
jgi:hypothetical protein